MSAYTLKDEVIYRGDEAVADVLDGKVKMRPESKKYAIQVGKFWKEAIATMNAQAQLPSEMITTRSETLHVPSPADTVTEAGFVKSDGAEVDASIPPAPPQDPLLGSKSPEYWAWLKKYRPEQAAEAHKGWGGR